MNLFLKSFTIKNDPVSQYISLERISYMNEEIRVFLSTIDLATDVTLTKPQTTGTIFLTSCDDSFFIHWVPFNGTPTQQITTVFNSVPELTTEIWSPNKSFLVNCNDLAFIEFKYMKDLLLIFHHNKFKQCRIFKIDMSEYVSIVRFIEQILINGIAVPGIELNYCLKIFKNCKKGCFSFKPLYIKLQDFQFKGMDIFWRKINSFYESFLSQLDSSGTLPNDPDFPLVTAARASHALFLKKIYNEIKKVTNYEKITEDEFSSLFNEEGRIIDQELFRKRLYHSGIDTSNSKTILTNILPFVLGLYPLNSTFEERKKIDIELDLNYKLVYNQMINIQELQKKKSKRITEAYKVIGNDVFRTDRGLNTFKNPKGIGSQILTNYLRMYSVLNPVLSYLQGMNDLFVPIIHAYLPNWTEDSSPIINQEELDTIKEKEIDLTFQNDEQDGTHQYDAYISHVSPKIFWCFDSMLKMTNQFALLADVTEYCKGVADTIHTILNSFSPIAATWMRRSGIKDLIWCYGDFVMMFKRTFSGDIWSLWLQFCCSPNPTRWMAYFMCAIIVSTFDQLACLPDVSLNGMMDAFPKILKKLDRHEIGEIAMWLAMAHPLPPIHSNEGINDDAKTEFRFFKTVSTENWSKMKDEDNERKENEKKATSYKECYAGGDENIDNNEFDVKLNENGNKEDDEFVIELNEFDVNSEITDVDADGKNAKTNPSENIDEESVSINKSNENGNEKKEEEFKIEFNEFDVNENMNMQKCDKEEDFEIEIKEFDVNENGNGNGTQNNNHDVEVNSENV